MKWALGSITTNKASGRDGIPVELFQILKDDAVESAALNMQYAICTQYAIEPVSLVSPVLTGRFLPLCHQGNQVYL